MKSALRNPAQSQASNDAVNAIKAGWPRGTPPFGFDPELMLAFNMGVDWAEKELGKQVGRRATSAEASPE